jgi:Uma2 family endonuclease
MRAVAMPSGEFATHGDQRIVIHGVSWAGFETFLELKGNAPLPRVAYIAGELELMSPSKHHERIKSLIGTLVVAYADEMGLVAGRYGSWTLKSAPREAGVEPDECFIVGADQDKDIPDLAIEVVWTRGGLGKLEIYRRLGVGEVWQWKGGRIQVHLLRRGRYVLAARSRLFPELDLHRFAALLDLPSDTEAIRALRSALAPRRRR